MTLATTDRALLFHRRGKRIRNFRRAWDAACTAAGCPDRIPHDFRRTAVRNLELASVSRSAAMAMVGHKIKASYRRYAIVDAGALRGPRRGSMLRRRRHRKSGRGAVKHGRFGRGAHVMYPRAHTPEGQGAQGPARDTRGIEEDRQSRVGRLPSRRQAHQGIPNGLGSWRRGSDCVVTTRRWV